MIYDRILNLHKYISEEDYRKLDSFLKMIPTSLEEKTYDIDGEHIYAKVMSYSTKDAEECRIEAHDRYIDIQCTICGAEAISVYRREDLNTVDEYNSEKDVVHFERQGANMIARTVNHEGYFTLLYPEEAHAPKEKVADFDYVKKFVIKLESK